MVEVDVPVAQAEELAAAEHGEDRDRDDATDVLWHPRFELLRLLPREVARLPLFGARDADVEDGRVDSLAARAESPPPTTAISFPRKKNPSHVAQLDTPCPISACSLGNPSHRALAPEAIISVRVAISPADVCSRNGCVPSSTLSRCAS